MNYLEHGDVILKRITAIPQTAKTVKCEKQIVLAEGEITGHAHRILDLSGAELRQSGSVMYLHLDQPKDLVHEEHGKLRIDPGDYEIDRVKEFNPFEREIRRIQD
jgi:hypothetical protein